jgi:predicted transposase/invertase (TIGR01784 family)
MGKNRKKQDVQFPHDSSYRYLLSSKKLFLELLRSFVNKGWVNQVDETQVEEIKQTFILPDFKRKEADIVYKVRLNGRDVIFYMLVELQSTVDLAMPYRLLLYQVEIWRYVLRNRDTEDSEAPFSLPVIVPMVLYNGQRPWTAKRRFRELLVGGESFGAELLDFEYILLDVERYTETELLALSNTIGSVFLLDQTADQALLLERLQKLMGTIRQMPEDLQTQFMNWLSNIIASQLPDKNRDVEQLIQELKEKGENTMGLQKNLEAIKQRGIEQGRELEKETVAKNLIALGLDNSMITAATGFPESKIEQLRNHSF